MNNKEMIDENLELQYHLMMRLLRDPDSLEIPEMIKRYLRSFKSATVEKN